MNVTSLCRLSAVVFTIFLVGCGKKPVDDMKSFEGDWIVVQLNEKGKAADTQLAKRLNLSFTNGKFSKVEINQNKLVGAEESAVRVDISKTPPEIDFVCLQGDNQGKTRPGIFQLENEQLTICYTDIGDARPTDFVAAPKATLMVLERKKKEGAP